LEKKLSDLNWIYLYKIFVAMYSISYTPVVVQFCELKESA